MTETQRGKIESLLANNATLLEVLSEPDCVSQSRWETQRGFRNLYYLCLSFSFNRAKVTEMLNFITVVHQPAPGESAEETKRLGHTVPYVASEIFNSEIKSVGRQFFYDGELEE
jgi:hypothetical protein